MKTEGFKSRLFVDRVCLSIFGALMQLVGILDVCFGRQKCIDRHRIEMICISRRSSAYIHK